MRSTWYSASRKCAFHCDLLRWTKRILPCILQSAYVYADTLVPHILDVINENKVAGNAYTPPTSHQRLQLIVNFIFVEHLTFVLARHRLIQRLLIYRLENSELDKKSWLPQTWSIDIKRSYYVNVSLEMSISTHKTCFLYDSWQSIWLSRCFIFEKISWIIVLKIECMYFICFIVYRRS